MSLTSHLNDPSSPVHQFIVENAAQLALAGSLGLQGREMASAFGFDEITARDALIRIPDNVKDRGSHAAVAGMALDYRLRMDLPGFSFAETMAQKGLDRLGEDLTAVSRGKHIHTVLTDALGFAFLTFKEKSPHPISLARASVPLAWCESIARVGPEVALSGELGRRAKRAKSATDLMMGIEDPLLLDIALMRNAVAPVIDRWNDEIAAGGKYTPNPCFFGSLAVGGADGDLVVGDVLVELKTSEKISNPWLRKTLFQLLGYTLLDVNNSHGISRVGILLPRQLDFVVWGLDDLLGHGATAALPEIRAGFADLLLTLLSDG